MERNSSRAPTPAGRVRLALAVATVAAVGGGPSVFAQDVVRIALPTKTYYPTIITETAVRQKLFDKEGLRAELTVYRGGAEAFEAVAAGAADVSLGSAAIIAAGIRKGVKTKGFAGAALGYYGWVLMVKTDSKVQSVSELEGKKVGITSAGSASDLLAQWTMADKKVNFTRVPLGGGGLVPNLITGNVEAVVLYSPLTFKVMQDKSARSLVDFGAVVPEHLTGVWLASDKLIADKPAVIQKTTNAVFGAMRSLRADRADAIKLIAEIDEIPPAIAEAELDGNILKLSTTGEITEAWMQQSLDLAKLIGMTDLAPVGETFTTQFKAVPTQR